MLFNRANAGAVGLDAAGNLDLACRTAGFDAERDGRRRDNDALDQRGAGAAERLDATVHDELADGLADLDADRAVGVGDDTVKFREVDRAGIDIEAARRRRDRR